MAAEYYDHEKEAAEVSRKIFRNMAPAKKYETLMSLRDFAWKMKAAGVRMQHPEFSEDEVQDRVREAFLYART